MSPGVFLLNVYVCKSISLFIAVNLSFYIQDYVRTDICSPSNNDGYLGLGGRKYYPKHTALQRWYHVASTEKKDQKKPQQIQHC